MNSELQNIVALLSTTPATLNAWLLQLPDFWTHANDTDNGWTALEVVGHLIHADRTDWIPRAKRILEYGESRAFEPFDREGHERDIQGKSLANLLAQFAAARREALAALEAMHLRPEDLLRRGMHPALGPVTLGQLLSTWAVHDLTHLHQISRTMAHQYGEAVGPFRAYLGVLRCDGHSSPA